MTVLLVIVTFVFSVLRAEFKSLFSHFCDSEQNFKVKFGKNLSSDNLSKAFGVSSRTIMSGSKRISRIIDWKDTTTQVAIPVVVNQIVLRKKFQQHAASRDLHFLNMLQKEDRVVKMYACLETERILEGPQAFYRESVNSPDAHVLYIVLEKLYGGFEVGVEEEMSIMDQIRSYDLLKRLEFYKQMAIAVSRLHLNEVVHGNIQPAAFKVADNTLSMVKITDFSYSGKVYSSYNGGTDLYKSPEAFEIKKLQYSLDVYSLGIAIFEIEIGREALTKSAEVYLIWRQKVHFLKMYDELHLAMKNNDLGQSDDSGENLTKIVLSCIAHNPKSRPDIEELIDRFYFLISKLKRPAAPTERKGAQTLDKKQPSELPVNYPLKEKINPEPINKPLALLSVADKGNASSRANLLQNSNSQIPEEILHSPLALKDRSKFEAISPEINKIDIDSGLLPDSELNSSERSKRSNDNMSHGSSSEKETISNYSSEESEASGSHLVSDHSGSKPETSSKQADVSWVTLLVVVGISIPIGIIFLRRLKQGMEDE
jgi:hypothetical protein